MSEEIMEMKQEPFMTFRNPQGEIAGAFDYRDGKWIFEGELEESAKAFVDYVIRELALFKVENIQDAEVKGIQTVQEAIDEVVDGVIGESDGNA